MSVNKFFVTVIILFSILPSFVFVSFSQPSITVGMVVVTSSFIMLSFFLGFFVINRGCFLFALIITIFILIHSFSEAIENPSKVAVSVVFLLIFILCANVFSNLILQNQNNIVKPIKISAILLLFFGFLSLLFKVNTFGFENYSKSVFFFYEPSHYALVLNPILLASMSFFKEKEKILIIIFVLTLGLLIPSLILILTFLLSLVLTFKGKRLFAITTSLLFALSLSLIWTGYDISYFLDRISLTTDTNNLSALVYLQGWVDAGSSLFDTNFVGLGFQNAGTNSENWVNYKIYELSGKFMNRNDGSFTASKLISEFGILGCLLVFTSIFLIINEVKKIKSDSGNHVDKIASGFIVSYVIELLFRSAGYFTIGTFFLFVGIILVFKSGINGQNVT
ncbi:TPA: hypothetical protein ACRZ2J_003005 [Vibrio campbellii]